MNDALHVYLSVHVYMYMCVCRMCICLAVARTATPAPRSTKTVLTWAFWTQVYGSTPAQATRARWLRSGGWTSWLTPGSSSMLPRAVGVGPLVDLFLENNTQLLLSRAIFTYSVGNRDTIPQQPIQVTFTAITSTTAIFTSLSLYIFIHVIFVKNYINLLILPYIISVYNDLWRLNLQSSTKSQVTWNAPSPYPLGLLISESKPLYLKINSSSSGSGDGLDARSGMCVSKVNSIS